MNGSPEFTLCEINFRIYRESCNSHEINIHNSQKKVYISKKKKENKKIKKITRFHTEIKTLA